MRHEKKSKRKRRLNSEKELCMLIFAKRPLQVVTWLALPGHNQFWLHSAYSTSSTAIRSNRFASSVQWVFVHLTSAGCCVAGARTSIVPLWNHISKESVNWSSRETGRCWAPWRHATRATHAWNIWSNDVKSVLSFNSSKIRLKTQLFTEACVHLLPGSTRHTRSQWCREARDSETALTQGWRRPEFNPIRRVARTCAVRRANQVWNVVIRPITALIGCKSSDRFTASRQVMSLDCGSASWARHHQQRRGRVPQTLEQCLLACQQNVKCLPDDGGVIPVLTTELHSGIGSDVRRTMTVGIWFNSYCRRIQPLSWRHEIMKSTSAGSLCKSVCTRYCWINRECHLRSHIRKD